MAGMVWWDGGGMIGIGDGADNGTQGWQTCTYLQ